MYVNLQLSRANLDPNQFCYCVPLSKSGSDSEGTLVPITPASNGRRPCTAGRYWRVHEYRPFKGGQPHNSTYIWVQFALEDKERGFVEIHNIAANATVKIVKVMNTTKGDFDLVKRRDNQYIYIGKIREGMYFFEVEYI